MASLAARLVVAVAVSVAFGWPLLATIAEATRGPGPSGSSTLIDPSFGPSPEGRVRQPLQLAATSLVLMAETEAVVVPLGTVLAILVFRTDAKGRGLCMGVLAIAAFVPMPLHATAWLGAFGNAGRAQLLGLPPLLAGMPGAVFVHAMAALPWYVLIAGTGLRAVEPEIEECALLDMPAWRVLATVTVRRGAAGIAAGALAVAVLTAGDMTVTDLLQIRTYAEEAYLQYRLGNGPAAAAQVALPPLALLGVIVALASYLLWNADPSRIASALAGGRTWTLGRSRTAVGCGLTALVVSVFGLPVAGLIWRAGRVGGLARAGQPPRWSLSGLWGTLNASLGELGLPSFPRRLPAIEPSAPDVGPDLALRGGFDWLASPLLTSILWASLAATFCAALAWGLAWLGRRSMAWRLVGTTLLALSLAAPGPVAGMALVLAYRDVPWIYDTAWILILAGVVRVFPYAMLILTPAAAVLPVSLIETGRLEGLGPSWLILRVVRPLMAAPALAAWCVSFALAVGELPATNLVAPPGTPPLTVVIWSLLHTGVSSDLAGVALVTLAVAGTAALLATWSLRRLLGPRPGRF